MKFGKTFDSLLTTEWRQMYMNYAELDAMIRRAVSEAPDAQGSRRGSLQGDETHFRSHVVEEYYKRFENEFFTVCYQELSRVEDFFAQKLAEARRKLDSIRIELTTNRRFHSHRNMGLYCSEFYLSLIMLQNFQSLNYTAFYKICKKYDKYIKSENGAEWFKQYVRDAPFGKEEELKGMIRNVEDLYTEYLANGDRAKAMAKLRVPPLRRPSEPSQVFLAGMFLGLFVVSSIMVLLSYIYLYNLHELTFAIGRLYRGLYTWVFLLFYLTINVFVWRNVGINHVLIFEVDMRYDVSPAQFLQVASCIGYICTLTTLMFLHHNEFGLDEPYHFPVACLGLMLLLMLNPFRICKFKARMWVARSMCRVFVAPFCHVKFLDFWIADQLTSMSQCLVDTYHLIRFCFRYYLKHAKAFQFEYDFMTPIIRCLPPWFRFAQCIRRYWDSTEKAKSYYINAFKYMTNIIAVLFSTAVMETNQNYDSMFANPWIYPYICTSLISSVYNSIWDLYWDFGLFKVWKGEHMFLRENLVFRKTFYYFVIVVNILIRFVWLLELCLIYYVVLLPYDCKTVASLLEMTRRFLWNFIRLENEHLNNCGSFRAIREIYLETIDVDLTEESPKKRMFGLLRRGSKGESSG